jgi:DNA-binding MarR family transcriptional regulator
MQNDINDVNVPCQSSGEAQEKAINSDHGEDRGEVSQRQVTAEGEAVRELLIELSVTFFRVQALTNRLAAAGGLTASQISMLRSIAAEGPQTVPEIARARPVARQPVQRMANELKTAGLLHWRPNPRHARSQLLELTPRGRKVREEMERHQAVWASKLVGDDLGERSIRRATRVLRRLRGRMPLTVNKD